VSAALAIASVSLFYVSFIDAQAQGSAIGWYALYLSPLCAVVSLSLGIASILRARLGARGRGWAIVGVAFGATVTVLWLLWILMLATASGE
jgi:hypothetical protein